MTTYNTVTTTIITSGRDKNLVA